MLSEQERQEYKEGILEVYEETGTTKLEFIGVSEETEPNIYGDPEDIVYLPPVTGLIGALDFSDDPEERKDLIPVEGKSIGYIDIPILSLEQKKLDPFKMINGKFRLFDITYQILDVIPDGFFTDFYTSYKFRVEMEVY